MLPMNMLGYKLKSRIMITIVQFYKSIRNRTFKIKQKEPSVDKKTFKLYLCKKITLAGKPLKLFFFSLIFLYKYVNNLQTH